MASHLCSSTLCIILTALDTGIQNIQNMFWYLAIKRSEIWAGNKSHLLWSNGYVESWPKTGTLWDQIWPQKTGTFLDQILPKKTRTCVRWRGKDRVQSGDPGWHEPRFYFQLSILRVINTTCEHISHVIGIFLHILTFHICYFFCNLYIACAC